MTLTSTYLSNKLALDFHLASKKLDSICCPQHRETEADTLKQLRPIGEGDQELEKRLVQKN
jgi:hypothetical protein